MPGAVAHAHLALPRYVDEHKFAPPIGMAAADYVGVATVDVKHALDLKGNILHALDHHQVAALIAMLGKFQHTDRIGAQVHSSRYTLV